MNRLVRSLAKVVFGNEGLTRRLEQSSWIQGTAQKLRARKWVNAALKRYPIRRVLPGSGVRYQIENFETLAVEKVYFGKPIYEKLFGEAPPATFIDLGCNSGIFPCLLTHVSRGRPLIGLCIDANAEQVAMTEKVVLLNGWQDVHVRHGLVGNVKQDRPEADFYLHPTSLGSSQFAYVESESGRAPDWQKIVVPALRVGDLWKESFGALRCDCLKIDIEGSEMNFFREEKSFLAQVDSILIEWHAWTTTEDEIRGFLESLDFNLLETLEATPRHGVLFFRRRHEHSKQTDEMMSSRFDLT